MVILIRLAGQVAVDHLAYRSRPVGKSQMLYIVSSSSENFDQILTLRRFARTVEPFEHNEHTSIIIISHLDSRSQSGVPERQVKCMSSDIVVVLATPTLSLSNMTIFVSWPARVSPITLS